MLDPLPDASVAPSVLIPERYDNTLYRLFYLIFIYSEFRRRKYISILRILKILE